MNGNRLAAARLYAFVDTGYLHGRSPEDLARALCDGGADLIQLRAKDLPPEQVQRLAERLLPITQRAGVPLVINDYPEIAVATAAEYCHLGQEDFFDAGFQHVADLCQRLGRTTPAATGATPNTALEPGAPPAAGSAWLKVGLSTHAPAQALRAVAAGAEYVAIGPVYATGTKPSARPVTLDYVRWAAAHLHLPWFAIGGISLDNLDAVLEAGARRVCVVSAILQAPEVTKACQSFKNRLLSAPL